MIFRIKEIKKIIIVLRMITSLKKVYLIIITFKMKMYIQCKKEDKNKDILVKQ